MARGWTLIEAAIVLGVLGVLIGSVQPSWQRWAGAHRLRMAAEESAAQLREARRRPFATARPVRLAIRQAAPEQWCLMLWEGAAGDCRCAPGPRAPQATCAPDAVLLHAGRFGADDAVRPAAVMGPISFQPDTGLVVPTGTLQWRHRDGLRLHQVVSITGRVRRCSPDDLPGVPRC